ncbi:MAG: two-component regulator propeller domain-containing protein, partial [Anaerolineae bacterium]
MKIEMTSARLRVIVVTLIVLLALGQRLSAAYQLPVDADEPVYTWVASHYATLMAHGRWAEIPQYTYTDEHPAFAKLVYALGLRAVGYEGDLDRPAHPTTADFPFTWDTEQEQLGIYMVDRLIAVVFGTLQVLILSLANPLAGALLAIHTLTVKYTAEIYLEAVPAFAVTAAFLAYDRVRRQGDGHTGWRFWLSAGLLGVAAASKYPYAAVGLALVPFIVWQQRRRPWNILLYGLLALGVFFALNPLLWPDPVGRLVESLRFHGAYTRSADVVRWEHPWWKPVNWMRGAGIWHPGVFWFPFDLFTFLASLAGLPFLYRQNRLLLAWFLTGWAILLLWPTKWPQYTLIVTPAICLSVGALGRAVAQKYDLHLDKETWERISFYLPDQTFWIAPPKWLLITLAAMVVLYGVGYGAYHINRLRQTRGWSTYTIEDNLADDRVNALASDGQGRVWIGTEQGLSVWEDGQITPAAESSALPANQRVAALASDAQGRVWIGTEDGVAVFDEGSWRKVSAVEMGLPEARVRSLATGPQGETWVGTRYGAAVWNGDVWRTVLPSAAGLSSDVVLALAVDPAGAVWIGTEAGLAVLNRSGAEPTWTSYTAFGSSLPANGLRALKAAPGGEMWIGTDGGGLCRVADGEWTCYRTANSRMPWNTVMALMLDDRGRVWAATH